jgi:hypothetical protein
MISVSVVTVRKSALMSFEVVRAIFCGSIENSELPIENPLLV